MSPFFSLTFSTSVRKRAGVNWLVPDNLQGYVLGSIPIEGGGHLLLLDSPKIKELFTTSERTQKDLSLLRSNSERESKTMGYGLKEYLSVFSSKIPVLLRKNPKSIACLYHMPLSLSLKLFY
ncbi:hypothetical protein AMTRI_Chr12g274740 [Amborella trichopoda]